MLNGSCSENRLYIVFGGFFCFTFLGRQKSKNKYVKDLFLLHFFALMQESNKPACRQSGKNQGKHNGSACFARPAPLHEPPLCFGFYPQASFIHCILNKCNF
jgi:hypothetical protein